MSSYSLLDLSCAPSAQAFTHLTPPELPCRGQGQRSCADESGVRPHPRPPSSRGPTPPPRDAALTGLHSTAFFGFSPLCWPVLQNHVGSSLLASWPLVSEHPSEHCSNLLFILISLMISCSLMALQLRHMLMTPTFLSP